MLCQALQVDIELASVTEHGSFAYGVYERTMSEADRPGHLLARLFVLHGAGLGCQDSDLFSEELSGRAQRSGSAVLGLSKNLQQ